MVLLWNTLRFHVANYLHIKPSSSKAFCVNIKLGPNSVTSLWLRPIHGDLFIFFEVLSGRCYLLPDKLLMPEAVRCIVDCGANIGITSLFFASRYRNATIYSVEPHPANFALLQQNVKGQPRIVPINAAIVGLPCPSVHFSTERPAWGNRIETSGVGLEVPAITISQLCEMHTVDRLDLLKIDIEGAEREVFNHADFLSRVALGVIELHGDYSFANFAGDVSSWGGVASLFDQERGVKMITFRGNSAGCQTI